MRSRSGCAGLLSIIAVVGLTIGFGQSLLGPARADASFLQNLSERYCEASHPFEAAYNLSSGGSNHFCERQHTVQQQDELCQGKESRECDRRTVYWSERNHTYTDRSVYQTYSVDNPSSPSITDRNAINLRSAYKMGAYGINWSVLFVDYRDRTNTDLVFLSFDGVSNIVYFVSWLFNTPQKFINQADYALATGRNDILYDLLFGIALFFVVDFPLALASTIFGVIGGTAFHLPSTIMAVPGGFYMLFRAVITAGYELYMSLWKITVIYRY